jgi:hypothetical protein
MQKRLQVTLRIATVISIWTALAIPAAAQQHGTSGNGANAGYCPAGSCAKGGGNFANNMKNCSPSYCKK